MVRWAYYSCLRPLESFRFEDENEYEYEMKVKVFARVLKKITRRKTSFYFFLPIKLIRLLILKEV